MKTKTSLIILLSCFLVFSCSNKKKELDKEHSFEVVPLTEDTVSSDITSTVYQTVSGKSIKLLINQGSSSLNDLEIIPLDFQHNKDTFKIKDADPLKNTWLLDLDQNGFEEIYLITSSVGSGGYETIYGYASNQDLSLTPIYVSPISEDDTMENGDFYGYMGHDSIYKSNNILYRKFPIYKEGDPNCCPTGGAKVLRYQLRTGEASWILEVVN